jgi:hypothetical protein
MKKIFIAGGLIHFLLLLSTCVSAQKHFANGEAVIRGKPAYFCKICNW